MKKTITTLILLFLISFSHINIYAQDSEEIITDEENTPVEINDSVTLRAEFIENTQNPSNKNIKFEMILKPRISSDRVQVNWQLTGVSIFINPENTPLLQNLEYTDTKISGNLSVVAGETYRFPITVRPTTVGVTEVYGTARLTAVDRGYLTTVRKNFVSNRSREILPITSEYKQKQTINFILTVVKIIGGIIGSLVIGFIILRAAVKWYSKDEKAIYDSKK